MQHSLIYGCGEGARLMLPKPGASEGTACTVQRILRDDSHAHVKLMKLPLCYHALCVSVCSFFVRYFEICVSQGVQPSGVTV
jgi:hypothetical protein